MYSGARDGWIVVAVLRAQEPKESRDPREPGIRARVSSSTQRYGDPFTTIYIYISKSRLSYISWKLLVELVRFENR